MELAPPAAVDPATNSRIKTMWSGSSSYCFNERALQEINLAKRMSGGWRISARLPPYFIMVPPSGISKLGTWRSATHSAVRTAE